MGLDFGSHGRCLGWVDAFGLEWVIECGLQWLLFGLKEVREHTFECVGSLGLEWRLYLMGLGPSQIFMTQFFSLIFWACSTASSKVLSPKSFTSYLIFKTI